MPSAGHLFFKKEGKFKQLALSTFPKESLPRLNREYAAFMGEDGSFC